MGLHCLLQGVTVQGHSAAVRIATHVRVSHKHLFFKLTDVDFNIIMVPVS